MDSSLIDTAPDAGDVAARIEQDINVGALSPGTWLKQIDLERRYGCTRIELRQALDGLVARRLVSRVPNRGYYVSEFDQRRIREIYEIRAILEVATAEHLIAQVTPAALAALRARAAAYEEATYNGTLVEQNDANQAFHRELLRLCPNRELAALVMDMRQRIPISVQRRWSSQSRMINSVSGHHRIVDALERRDLDGLKATIADHILGNLP